MSDIYKTNVTFYQKSDNLQLFMVKSENSPLSYMVIFNGDEKICSCPDYFFRKNECKHIKNATLFLQLEDAITGLLQ